MTLSRTLSLGCLASCLSILAACGPSAQQREAERQRVERDRHSAAFQAGRIANDVAREAGKAAAVAGHALGNAARKADEGWKEQSRQNREKDRR